MIYYVWLLFLGGLPFPEETGRLDLEEKGGVCGGLGGVEVEETEVGM